jgi:8-oxo-dGTP diphosphatase
MIDSREYPSRPIPGVGVVVRKGDQILLIRRDNPPRRGEWSIPGGAVELGETWRETAVREVREECGIEIKLGEVIDAIDILQRDRDERAQYHYAIVDFAATYASGELRAASDVLDARWVAPSELDAFNLPELAREVIDKLLARESRHR